MVNGTLSRANASMRRHNLRMAVVTPCNRLGHDPEKREAVFRKDHAQTTSQAL
jgi:hypothetical protein